MIIGNGFDAAKRSEPVAGDGDDCRWKTGDEFAAHDIHGMQSGMQLGMQVVKSKVTN